MARRGTVVLVPDGPPPMPVRTRVEKGIALGSTVLFAVLGVLAYIATAYVVWLDSTD